MSLAIKIVLSILSMLTVWMFFLFVISASHDAGVWKAARAQCSHISDDLTREECEEDIVAYTYGIK